MRWGRMAYSKSKTNTDQAYLNNKVSEMKKKLKIVKKKKKNHITVYFK